MFTERFLVCCRVNVLICWVSKSNESCFLSVSYVADLKRHFHEAAVSIFIPPGVLRCVAVTM